MIQPRSLDILFWEWSFSGDEVSDTSSERSLMFVEIVRTHDRKLGLIDLSRFWNIRIFNKILNFGGYVFRVRFGKRESRRKRNMR